MVTLPVKLCVTSPVAGSIVVKQLLMCYPLAVCLFWHYFTRCRIGAVGYEQTLPPLPNLSITYTTYTTCLLAP